MLLRGAVIALFIFSGFLPVPVHGQAAAAKGGSPGPLKNEKGGGRPRVALVLSGGGAVGAAHLPVLEAIEELDIPIDMIIGISMGAIVGGLYCCGRTLPEIKTMMLTEDWTPVFTDRPRNSLQNALDNSDFPIKITLNKEFQPSLPSGYSSGVYAYELLKSNTVKIPSYYDFDTLPIPFRSGAVNALSGEFEIFGSGDIAESLRASMSIPGVFQPVPIDGKYYIDGGVKNNFPLNVAKEFGFDIIIGVDIVDKLPEITKDEPHENILDLRRNSLGVDRNIKLLTQMAQINFLPSDEPQWDVADLIIAPDIGNYTMLDFLKVEEIYNSSAKDKQRYIDALLPIKKKIEAAVKEAPPLPPSRVEASYSAMPYIVIENVRFEGLLPFDSAYINGVYDKLIKDKEFTEKNLNGLLHIIYNTGNYDYVITRVNTRDGINTLDVILANNSIDLKNTQFSASVAYEGTMSSDSAGNVSITGRVYFNGLSGPNSQLSLALTALSNISGEISYFFPLTPDMFLFGDVTALRKQMTAQSGLIDIASPKGENKNNSSTSLNLGEKILFGIKFNESNLLTLGPGFDYMSYSSGQTNDADSFTSSYANAFSFNFDYKLSTLNSAMYARKGIYLNLINTFVFPVRKDAPVYNMVSVDTSAAFAVSESFSIIANMFAGADVINNLIDKENFDQKPFFGFTTDRMYFPQIAGNIYYYSNKAAASLMIQFRPWHSITIFGGQIIVSIGASAGRLDDRLRDFIYEIDKFDEYYWNTSINFGLRVTDKSGISLRAGAGKTLVDAFSPFVALDVGVFRY
jgi:NTE family protein